MFEHITGLRRTGLVLAFASLMSAGASPAWAQDAAQAAQVLANRPEFSANTNLSGIAANGSGIGRMDTSMGTPVIHANDVTPKTSQISESDKSKEISFKPLPRNDFQNFIMESTGKDLPLFGIDYFISNIGSFNSPNNVPVSSDYRFGPGDEIQIKGWGSVDIDVRTVVDRNGLIHIPRVGSVQLAGVRSSQAEATIRSAISRYYRDFELSVTQGQLRGITVYVVGQARQPGAYQLSGTSTLVAALFASGGPNQQGSMRHIQVKRSDRLVTELDLYDFIGNGNKSADVRLQDGDTIVIPPARGYVALTGAVNIPAIYEIDGDKDTLASILSIAGGLPVVADPKQAYLERVDPTKKPSRTVEAFPLDIKNMQKRVRNGDLLTIMTLSPEFGNAVTLRGNVDQQVRTPWREGIRIRDLIPDRTVLVSRTSVQRQNDSVKVQNSSDSSTLSSRVGQLIDEVNFEYAVVERVNSQQLSMQLIPFNLGKALDDPNSSDNLLLQPGDIVTIFSVNDVRVPQAKRQVFVRVEGEVASPGVYQMNSGEGLLELIHKAGGLTADAYLFGSEFYRESVRQAQQKNLEKFIAQMEVQSASRLNVASSSLSSNTSDAIQGAQQRLQAETQSQQKIIQRLKSLKPTGRILLNIDADSKRQRLPSLRLENQDQLLIPAKPDFVYVLGAVNAETALIWQPGKNTQHYMNQSGLTYSADVDEVFVLRADGSVVTRKSTGWFSSVSKLEILPGDTIVLPEKIIAESAWSAFTRNAKDITQIIYQFSLGAAAIKTLRE